MDFLQLAENRYSCKKFDGRKVERETLMQILQAGRVAPTAKNLQEHHIYVLENPANLQKVDELTPCRYGAGTVLLVAYDKTNVYNYPNSTRTSGVEDATIVATHLMLAAASLKVDSCWLNFFNPEKAAEIFELPDNEEVLMLLDLGYAAADAKPTANHQSRKPLSQTVTFR